MSSKVLQVSAILLLMASVDLVRAQNRSKRKAPAAAPKPAAAQPGPKLVGLVPGPQVLTFFSDVDDSEQPYGLYLPPDFDPGKKYPLVIMLHGGGSNHRLDLRRVFGKSNLQGETDVEATRYFPKWKDVHYIVASPLARGTMGYQGIAEKDVYDMLSDVQRRFPIDPDRIYLTGLSMGGGGVLWLGLTRPDIWAAIAAVCPAPPEEANELAANASNLSVSLFQGGADDVVDPAETRLWAKRLEDGGARLRYTEYPGVKHTSWENAYRDEAIFQWFGQFHRDRYPVKVHFSTSWYKYNRAYWLQIDDLTPGVQATVDARFIGLNRLEVTTSALGAITLDLAGHPRFSTEPPLEIIIDKQPLKVIGQSTLSLVRSKGIWQLATHAKNSPRGKREGAEGPIRETIASRHIYVYGTGGNPSAEELESRREQARQAATWSTVDFSLLMFPRVLADTEVRPSDIGSSNLILFGNWETNLLLQRYSNRLPIQLLPSAKDYGLVYVFPIDGHYVLVASGVSWWRPSRKDSSPAPERFSFLSAPAVAALMNMQDFLLFKESRDNVIAEGHFDGDWQLPEPDAKKMRSSGVIAFATERSRSQARREEEFPASASQVVSHRAGGLKP